MATVSPSPIPMSRSAKTDPQNGNHEGHEHFVASGVHLFEEHGLCKLVTDDKEDRSKAGERNHV